MANLENQVDYKWIYSSLRTITQTMCLEVIFIITMVVLITREKMCNSVLYDVSCTVNLIFLVRFLNANNAIVVNKVNITTVKKVCYARLVPPQIPCILCRQPTSCDRKRPIDIMGVQTDVLWVGLLHGSLTTHVVTASCQQYYILAQLNYQTPYFLVVVILFQAH